MDTLIERHIRSTQRVECQRPQNIGRRHQGFRRQQRQRADSQHRLRPIDEGDGLLGFCNQRFHLRAFHGVY